ncbi:protein serine/threonine phosphatase 2C [Marasmius fiardii PR-910]|nr:protein serine/threonine phosphatase 2C [Marasmius fiardii PR-910]
MSLFNSLARALRQHSGWRHPTFTTPLGRRRYPGSTLVISSTVTVIVAGSAIAMANGKKIQCDFDVDDEAEGASASPSRFKKPRWKPAQYLSADEILRGGPSWWPRRPGIDRCDALTVPSNVESEDYIAVYFDSDDETEHKTFIGLFDGHHGTATSEFLSDNMITFLQHSLAKLPQQYHYSLEAQGLSPFEDGIVHDTIKYVFREIDEAITDPSEVLASSSKTNAVRTLRQAYSGSCALVSIYDPDTRLLRIALTGDSRAVLGRKIKAKDGGKDTYAVHVLTVDQNAHNPAEVARMKAEHPGENLFEDGTVMGWRVTRAFGNAAYKWSVETQRKLYTRFLGDRPMDDKKTPPYLTAEPVVTNFVVEPGDFLVMGSDGLWDCLTNEEVVGLVGIWLRQNGDAVITKNPKKDFEKKREDDKNTYRPNQLPVTLQKDDTFYYKFWQAEKCFVNRDRSAAAHLVRNALGGADADLTDALLSMTSPRSRQFRDDISVVVTFFS